MPHKQSRGAYSMFGNNRSRTTSHQHSVNGRFHSVLHRCPLVAAIWCLLALGQKQESFVVSLHLLPLIHAKAAAIMTPSASASPNGHSTSSLLLAASSFPEKEAKKLLEVEEKFSFSDRSKLEERLKMEGFALCQEVIMVDWYYDRLVANSECLASVLPLVRNDHWLRYRQITSRNCIECVDGEAEWQLKRGTSIGGGDGGATVYEEIEGTEALKIACSLANRELSKRDEANPTKNETALLLLFEGESFPVPPVDSCDLQPFAKIVTHRAKWEQRQGQQPTSGTKTTNASLFSKLVVDLDTTPDGFAVGEVEALVEAYGKTEGTSTAVYQEEAVAMARTDIRELLERILKGDDNNDDRSTPTRSPSMGKLEQFLFLRQPLIHKVCVESGVIPQPPFSAEEEPSS
ncbi:unnamed protein product [Pseudo-nitzschia multistriata]|uniref:Uncharacterized protein n=1 Tax=Pseudo-nitzschia multistriata TaxID=183589 RepID=A0A448ZKX3_9STRA|nr:unnamed protein product [Pseudo-nitzschia multistriata]